MDLQTMQSDLAIVRKICADKAVTASQDCMVFEREVW